MNLKCSVCDESLDFNGKTFKLGREIEGIKYCDFCGRVKQLANALKNQPDSR